MNKKTRDLYDAAIDKIIDVFATEFPDLTINIERSMTDYESAIQGALIAAFMGCECSGCWFHYKQVVHFLKVQSTIEPKLTFLILAGDLATSTEVGIAACFQPATDYHTHFKRALPARSASRSRDSQCISSV